MEMSTSTTIYCTSGAYCEAQPQPTKENFLKEVIRFLRRLLGYCLCAVTCGCVPPPKGPKKVRRVYPIALSDLEREAVKTLLDYMDSKAFQKPTIDDENMYALCILTFTDYIELQRAAALIFFAITQKSNTITAVAKRSLRRVEWYHMLYDDPWDCHREESKEVSPPGGCDGSDSVFDDINGATVPLTTDIMEPLLFLLQSRDMDVLRAASLAVSNFAKEGPKKNQDIIVESGCISLLINLLSSKSYDVQYNACACITNLSKGDDKNKVDIMDTGASQPLLKLCQSPDLPLQQSAVGAVLNLTHLIENLDELVTDGVIPILVDVQNSKDIDIQYYSTAALSNLSILERYRTMMVAVGHHDVVRQLITLAQSPVEKVRCQAIFVLRNLACDSDNKPIIIRYDCLPVLKEVLVASSGVTFTAVVACVRNLSVHRANQAAIICESFLPELQKILISSSNLEVQKLAASTIRNLSGGDYVRVLVNTDNIDALCTVLLQTPTNPSIALLSVLIEITAALGLLADEEEVKYMMLGYQNGKVISKLIDLANRSSNVDVRYNCAGTLGQISVIAIPSDLIQANSASILSYLTDFLHSNKNNCVHVALWTFVQLLDDKAFLKTVQRSPLPKRFIQLEAMPPSPEIQELVTTVIDKLIATNIDDSRTTVNQSGI